MKEKLTTEKVSKLIRNLAIPSIIGLMIGVVYNIVDRMFIAKGVGTLGIAGISITLPITIFYLALSLLVGVGASVMISIALGKNDIKKSEKIIGSALSFYIIIGIILIVLLQIFLKDVLMILGATEQTLPYAMEYSRYFIIGTIFSILIPGFNNIIRATGSPNSVMYYLLTGAFLNIILDWYFIMKLNMSMKGAAIATVISLGVSAFLMLGHFVWVEKKIKIRLKYLKIRLKLLHQMMILGSGIFILQLAGSLSVIFINNRFKIYGGDIYIAAYGIINSLIMLIRLPVMGVQQASQVVVSYNLGAKKYARILEAYKIGMKIAFIISLVGFLLAQFCPKFLVGLFITGEPELTKVTVVGIRLFFSTVFLQGINIIATYLFMSLGEGKRSFHLNILQQIVLTLPLIYILPVFFGAEGAWVGVPLAELIAAFVIQTLAYKKVKEIKLKIKEG